MEDREDIEPSPVFPENRHLSHINGHEAEIFSAFSGNFFVFCRKAEKQSSVSAQYDLGRDRRQNACRQIHGTPLALLGACARVASGGAGADRVRGVLL